MSNISKAYADSISDPSAKQEEAEKPVDAGLKELKWNWLNSSITQEVFKSIVEDENKLLDFAINEACKSQPESIKIVQILVRVDTLRKLRKDFSNQQPQQPNTIK
jgi:hypothetical protein